MEGRRLGPYRIDRELGSGGMGRVYAATDEDGATVALKVVHAHLLEQPGFFKRFLREADIGKSVRHENVVRTLDCDALGPHHYLVMEYVEGRTLADLQQELDTVPEELCRHVAREICKGLAAIHDAGVVHRDLKPENVLITPDHVVKVMDLGVARLADEQMRLSRSGAFVGSVEYAAPEQFKGEDVDGRTDLHALGVLLYELTSGKHPYAGGSFHDVLARVCDQEPRRLGELNPQLSALFEELVHTLLVKDPRGRFASATQVLEVLERGEESAWWRDRARLLQAETSRPLRRIRIPRETAVYGREAELDRLRALYDAAERGEGRVVLVEGEAGIGKSRLVDEFVARLRDEGEELHFLFGSYPPGGAATAAGGFSSAYREHFGEAGSSRFLTQTPLLAPAFDAVLRGEPAPRDAVELTAQSVGTCFVHATHALAAERPTVVLIDDLHFAPQEALQLFISVALAAAEHRVLLVGTLRPGVPDEWVANVSRLDHASRLELARLGPKDLGLLLRESFRSEHLAEELGWQIAQKSDGNPFFAFEIIRGLREGQFIEQGADGTWSSTGAIDKIEIPSSVLDLVKARVANLRDEERHLLDVAACWGYEFDATLVGEALGLRRLPVLQTMARIEHRDRLVRSSGRRFVFDHHQVQEALHDALPELLREEYHAALAEALEERTQPDGSATRQLDGATCVDLCTHYLAGARGRAALPYLEDAQEHLADGYLHAQVVALTERALAVPGLLEGPSRARALLRLTSALDEIGRRDRQEECAREAERLAAAAGDDDLRGRAARLLGVCLGKTSRNEEAERVLLRGLELARACGDREAEAAAMGNLAHVYSALGRLDDAREHHERNLEISRAIGNRQGEAMATGNLGLLLHRQARYDEAQEHFERHLSISREIGYRRGEAVATGNLGNVHWAQGRLREARDCYERHRTLSREIGNRLGEATATGNLGGIDAYEGRFTASALQYERQLAICREIGDREGEARAIGGLSWVLVTQGRFVEAKPHIERYLETSRAAGDRVVQAHAHHERGRVHLEEGELASAEDCFRASLELCETIGYRRMAASAQGSLGAVLAESGDFDGARGRLEAARDIAAEIGFADTLVLVLCDLACLPGGDAADALAAVAEHGDRLSPLTRREAHWRLFEATGDRAHLEEAKRLLDDLLASNPPEHHASMCRNVRVNREILAAWREQFGADDDTPDGASPPESPTRAG